MSKTEVTQGQIWQVTTDNFRVNWDGWGKEKYFRKILLEKCEKIEIRFPFEWHFRTADNFYFQATEEDLIKNCKLFGTIWENVRFLNNANLKDILRIGLYDKHKEGK